MTVAEREERIEELHWEWAGWIDRTNRELGLNSPRDIVEEAASLISRVLVEIEEENEA